MPRKGGEEASSYACGGSMRKDSKLLTRTSAERIQVSSKRKHKIPANNPPLQLSVIAHTGRDPFAAVLKLFCRESSYTSSIFQTTVICSWNAVTFSCQIPVKTTQPESCPLHPRAAEEHAAITLKSIYPSLHPLIYKGCLVPTWDATRRTIGSSFH
ncbi:hypothetical protein FQA47_024216, partial [Oryzias melastigma]